MQTEPTSRTARCRNCSRVIHGCECGTCDGWRHAAGDHICPSGWTGTDTPTYAEPVGCRRCGRHLRSASAVAAGYGRTCLARKRAEDRLRAVRESVAAFSRTQRDKAEQVIMAGKLRPLSREGLYQVTGSDGVTTYLTSALGPCPCQARGLCYHRAAAAMADAYREAA